MKPNTTNEWTITIPEQFVDFLVERELLPPRTPVEAPKFSRLNRPNPTPAERDLWPGAQLIIECVTDSDGKPLEEVRLQLGRDDVYGNDPFALKSAMARSDENGRVDFGVVPPGQYNLWAYIPNENDLPPNEHLHRSKQFTVHGPDPVTKTITCPSAPPPRASAEYKIHWPDSLARDDIWLVLEMTGVRERRTRDSEWVIADWHLAAIHPDGRTIVWTKPTDEYYSLYSLEMLPINQRLSDLVAKLSSDSSDTPISPSLLAEARFHILGVGIARWDGTGSPDELLAGIRDGRYRSPGGGAFFYALREIAPMKAKQELPTLTMNQSDEGQPTLEYTVPPSLIQSALRRWDGLPIASK